MNFEDSNLLLCSHALAIQSQFRFQMNFWITFSFSAKITTGILAGIVLNVQIALGSMHILTLLSLSIHEHGMSFLLFVFPLIFLQCFIVFSIQIFSLPG